MLLLLMPSLSSTQSGFLESLARPVNPCQLVLVGKIVMSAASKCFFKSVAKRWARCSVVVLTVSLCLSSRFHSIMRASGLSSAARSVSLRSSCSISSWCAIKKAPSRDNPGVPGADLFACGTDNRLGRPPIFMLIIASFLVRGGPTAVGIDRSAVFTRPVRFPLAGAVASCLMVYTFGEGGVCIISLVRHSFPRFPMSLKQQRLCLLLGDIKILTCGKPRNAQVFEETSTGSGTPGTGSGL